MFIHCSFLSLFVDQAARGSTVSALAPTRDSMGQRSASNPRSLLARSSYAEDRVSRSSTSTIVSGMWHVSRKGMPSMSQLGPDRMSVISGISGISGLTQGEEDSQVDERDSGVVDDQYSLDKLLTGLPGDPYRHVREDSV